MDELGDRINQILGDPAQMEKLAGVAKSIMGGGPPKAEPAADTSGLDPALMGKIAGIMSKRGVKSERLALLEAMKPYLSEKRRKKMERAVRLASLAGLAGLAMEEFGDV